MRDSITVESSAASYLMGVFREYIKYNARELPQLVIEGGRKLAEELFIQTPRASASEIWAKLHSLGWRFKRAPWKYIAKVGGQASPLNDTADDRRIKETRRKRLGVVANLRKKAKALTRTRKTKADLDNWKDFTEKQIRRRNRARAKRYAKMEQNLKKAQAVTMFANVIEGKYGRHYTLAEQRFATYNYRKNHIGAMASSWIPAMRQLGSKMTVAAGEKRGPKMRPMCKVQIDNSGSIREVTIINMMPGIAKLAMRRGFVDKAMLARARDMEVYIERKKEELATIFNPTGSR